ncbi:23S rRNA (guanosine(2251)-2'-O)-methyltransferase RlmB [Derxia gummosa]|uniref:23S rRNA (guanosine-2'-O-)-methyltransferase RlmB n=1 Tax=Derxia gummosa DSM 723 TaxID=1121388 RepID=A0A8B6X6G1_9BURK|nr:23S rRNA (guanosine(2251)-2'-O)-methyltransferase RlmB [Derxia gummosa]
MSKPSKVLHGFHAVTARLRHAPASIKQLYVEASRRDKRMQDFIQRATEAGLKLAPVDAARLTGVAGTDRHQGVAAVVDEIEIARTLDDVLDLMPEGQDALLLVLDSITDPHNLGACLRVADGAGAHAVVAPKDRAAGLSGVAAKAASGAAESMPYVVVTNLARSLREMKDAGLRVIGTADDAPRSIYEADLTGPIALVLGAEGEGMRRLTRDTCDELVSIPMAGAVESLNVSVASGVCLYEAVRQRGKRG